jgi:hypothetical protein
MRHPGSRSGGTVSRRTAPQKRYSLRHISILDLDPAARNRPLRTPDGEILLGRTAITCFVRSPMAALSPTSECSLAPYTRLTAKTTGEPASEPQRWLRYYVPMPGSETRDREGRSPDAPVLPPGVLPGLMDQRAVTNRIVERERLF